MPANNQPWKLDAITVHLRKGDTAESDHLTWGFDGTKGYTDFVQMILFEIEATLIDRNLPPAARAERDLHPEPERTTVLQPPATPRAAKSGGRGASSRAPVKSKKSVKS